MQVIVYINKEKLSDKERLELLDEIYWLAWDMLSIEYPEETKKIFSFLRNNEFSEEEISLILKLYNNPHGAYTQEFSHIISNIYNKDKIKFIKALHLVPEEVGNLVYLFRNNKVFNDEEIELMEILSKQGLAEEEIDTANTFFRMYKTVCST